MAASRKCDVLIVGGGTGGCAAAMAATSYGLSVVMTEETDWIGGQLTSQLVPPDEHKWIESFGSTFRYRVYRDGVRQFYRDHFPLTPEAKANPFTNPGGGWVSRLCHDPRVGIRVLRAMLRDPIADGRLELLLETKPTGVSVNGSKIESVELLDLKSGGKFSIEAAYVLDATELGDLLPMAGAEYVSGAESKADTGEDNAIEGPAQSNNVQGFTWCYALALDEGSHRVIDRPYGYEKWRSYSPSNWVGPLLDFTTEHPITGAERELPLFHEDPANNYSLFSYRQIIDPKFFEEGKVSHPVTVVNWPMNDYFVAPVIDVPEADALNRLEESKQLGLSLLCWLQTEAPRHDGGTGYPGLYLRDDVSETTDGFAKTVYHRESRRIRARFTVTEQMVSEAANPGLTVAPSMPKSIGIGSYRIDLHPSTSGARTIDTGTLPFQIPLGSLIPIRIENLLPACKNLGVTHITNGCYRLHPVEWNIGESAGLLAAFCILAKVEPVQVLEDEAVWANFAGVLLDQGIETEWQDLL